MNISAKKMGLSLANAGSLITGQRSSRELSQPSSARKADPIDGGIMAGGNSDYGGGTLPSGNSFNAFGSSTASLMRKTTQTAKKYVGFKNMPFGQWDMAKEASLQLDEGSKEVQR